MRTVWSLNTRPSGESLYATENSEPRSRSRLPVSHRAQIAIVLAAALVLRMLAAGSYNSPHIDEAIYVSVGQDALAGVFEQNASAWMFGSYLYPILTAIANDLGGLAGMRLLSALFLTASTLFVYLSGRALFDTQAAVLGALLFALAGPAINLGQLAVIDAPGVLFMAATLYLLVQAPNVAPSARRQLYLAAAGTYVLSLLFKYIAAAYFPALACITVLLALAHRQPARRTVEEVGQYFVLPVIIIAGIYFARDYRDLLSVFSGRYASQIVPTGLILSTLRYEIGAIFLLATGGLVAAVLTGAGRRNPQLRHGWVVLALTAIFLSALLLPLYHLVTSNFRSLSKHVVYSLLFLTPLAGLVIARLAALFTRLRGRLGMYLRAAGTAAVLAGLLLFVDLSLRQNAEFHDSWPDARSLIREFRSLPLSLETRVLSPSAPVLEFYSGLGVVDREVWTDAWYMEYLELEGDQAVLAALADQYFDVVVLDGYYRPEIEASLEAALLDAGYEVVYQQRHSGLMTTDRIYVLPDHVRAAEGSAN